MDQGTIIRLLRVCASTLRRHRNIKPEQSCWIWGLLGRLGEVGTLPNDKMWVVRDLGKKAVWVRCGFVGGAIEEGTAAFRGSDESEEEDWILDNLNGEREADNVVRELRRMDKNHDDHPEAELHEVVQNDILAQQSTREDPIFPGGRLDEQGDGNDSISRSISASEDGEVEPIESVETAKERLLSRITSLQPPSKSHASPSISSRTNGHAKKNGCKKHTLPPTFIPRGRKHRRTGPCRRRNTSSPLLSPDRSESTNGFTQNRSEKRRNTPSLLPSPIRRESTNGSTQDTGRRQKNTSSPPEYPHRVAAEAQAQSTWLSRSEAEAQRLRQRELKPEPHGKTSSELIDEEGDEQTGNEMSDANTFATIDMILSVVGEVYGQRDLLEFREVWGTEGAISG